ncbi:MAG TPA: PVC-type heme-binding CxxCH protein, partial [Pirellulales bacterium]|nr:PVC-type heme-binding CxxCH protein [Pirellulales bacterium]
MHRKLLPATLAIAACLAVFGSVQAGTGTAILSLEQGDHISVIGNTLAERMQHHGWLETMIHARFPKHELSFRNLGISGDELTLRLRSQGFGSPDEWLTRTKADVVFAFFGYNESFADQAGLDTFKRHLDEFVKHTLGQRYNGKSAPTLVLFSPIAHEDLHDRNLPDGTENNRRIKLYTAPMAEVAKAHGVVFVDLFAACRELYTKAGQPLTINGVHLNERGDRLVAEAIDTELFREPTGKREPAYLEKLRSAVLDKNFYWFERYRTVDGYSIFGGRADLSFVDGQTNRVVMQREMEVLDVMTANRDRRIWAVAQRSEYKVDDGNAPPFLAVKTNKPGEGPDGAHLFASGEAEIEKMTVAKGFKVNLFASEEMFPELAKPVQMAFDAKGRLWVACMPSYPHWKPGEEMNDLVLILDDSDGDGRADNRTVFANKLHVPTGLDFYAGGLLVGQQPDLMYLKDTDGDDVADVRERVVHGIDSADTHHALNSFTFDPGGALYFQEGTFHHTQVETAYGPPQRCANAGVFRYEPRSQKFEVYVTYGFANPHGHVFDRWGQDLVTDGTGSDTYFAAAFSGRLDFPQKHPGMQKVYAQWTRPCPATEIVSSRHFPDEMQGNLLVPNVIGYRGILQYKLNEKDSAFEGN